MNLLLYLRMLLFSMVVELMFTVAQMREEHFLQVEEVLLLHLILLKQLKVMNLQQPLLMELEEPEVVIIIMMVVLQMILLLMVEMLMLRFIVF